MSVLRLQAQIPIDELLKAVEQLPQSELEAFVKQVLAIRAQLQLPSLSEDESTLFLEINRGISPDVQRRFDELITKRQSATLTQLEQEELIELSDQIELLNAERIRHLGELARLRGRSLSEVMEDLGIEAPTCV